MSDCFVCALPAEVQGEFAFNEEDWATMLCANGHWVVLRTAELPAAIG